MVVATFVGGALDGMVTEISKPERLFLYAEPAVFEITWPIVLPDGVFSIDHYGSPLYYRQRVYERQSLSDGDPTIRYVARDVSDGHVR